jgi:hypothetical protein
MDFSSGASVIAEQAQHRSIAVTPDALIIIVPLRKEVRDRKTGALRPARYPSVNKQTSNAVTFGRKTEDYEALYQDEGERPPMMSHDYP